jgi:hypothetical protein
MTFWILFLADFALESSPSITMRRNPAQTTVIDTQRGRKQGIVASFVGPILAETDVAANKSGMRPKSDWQLTVDPVLSNGVRWIQSV